KSPCPPAGAQHPRKALHVWMLLSEDSKHLRLVREVRLGLRHARELDHAIRHSMTCHERKPHDLVDAARPAREQEPGHRRLVKLRDLIPFVLDGTRASNHRQRSESSCP